MANTDRLYKMIDELEHTSARGGDTEQDMIRIFYHMAYLIDDLSEDNERLREQLDELE